MTIFDSIKYPISDIPTIEELNAVPESIYQAWLVYNGWNLGMKREGIVNNILYWKNTGDDSRNLYLSSELNILRKMIRVCDDNL